MPQLPLVLIKKFPGINVLVANSLEKVICFMNISGVQKLLVNQILTSCGFHTKILNILLT